MAHNPRACTRCEANAAERATEGIIAGIRGEWLPCAVCGEPTCDEHGHEYGNGFAHEDCHNLPDYTRADDGRY